MDGAILMDPGPTCSRWALLQISLVPEVSNQVAAVCMGLRPQTPWEASLAIQTVSSGALAGLCLHELGHRPDSQEGKKCQLWSLLFPAKAPEML
jgi:hypothetical protein